jgi:hypothetical protein
MEITVKGTILTDLVKIVRKEPQRAWNDYLKPEDWDIINREILATQWYPGAFFYRLSYAVFKVVANSDLKVCFDFGKIAAHNLAQVYKFILVPGDPAVSMERFLIRRKAFFSGAYSSAEMGNVKNGHGWLTYLYTNAQPEVKGSEVAGVIAHTVAGALYELAGITGGRNVSSKVVKKGDFFEIRIEWK